MEWFRFIKNVRVAAKPPAYILERISDLKHACELSKTAPREANVVISQVIEHLSQQKDDNFIPPLQEAEKIMLDSPRRAADAIEKVIVAMINEKDIFEAEREDDDLPWKKSP